MPGRRGSAVQQAPRPCRTGRSMAREAADRGWENRSITPTGASPPAALRDARATTRIASSEWPPRSKKSSSMPIVSTPSTSAQIVGERAARSRSAARPATARRVAGCRRRGQRLAVELAVGGQRQLVERDERGRHHVLGQLRPQAFAQVRGVGRGSRRPGQVADEALVAAGCPRGTTTAASRTPGWSRERGLDLAELDAEAAHLHLVVDAAEELDRRRRRASGPGRRCGRGARRAVANGSATKRSAVRAGRPR